jgi:hypothetical protein
MPEESVGQYGIEYEAVELGEVAGWAAYVTVYGPSANPMHRSALYPRQRVHPDVVYPDRTAAERAARDSAHALVAKP